VDDRERAIWREALRATSLGWELALPIFGGVWVGYLLGRLLDSAYICTLGFLLLGIASGFYSVMRSILRLDERSRRQRREDREAQDEESEAVL